MVYETVENGTHDYEKEGGMVGAGSKPVIDETESLTSNSNLSTNIYIYNRRPLIPMVYSDAVENTSILL